MPDFKWEELPPRTKRPLQENQLRSINVQVQCVTVWSDKIIEDRNEETGEITYTSGYIFEILPNQSFIAEGVESQFLGTFLNKKES